MKVVHVLKRVEAIDEDIKELRKLEKSVQRNKTFSTPIYMSIEAQINHMLDERIKLFGLTIANPPADLEKAISGEEASSEPVRSAPAAAKEKTARAEKPEKKPRGTKPGKQKESKPSAAAVSKFLPEETDEDSDEIDIITQDDIDAKFAAMQKSGKSESPAEIISDDENDDGVKLLDLALEKGTLNKKDIDSEKRKVKFFRESFPGSSY